MHLLLAFAACTVPDPALALRELAEANAGTVFTAIRDGIEAAEGVDLDALDDGAELSGALDAGAGVGVDWTVTYGLEDDWIQRWDWTFDVDYAPLALPSCGLEGAGAWTVAHTRIEFDYADHAFAGTLALDGGEPQDASYEAYYSGNLHWVRGAIGETLVDWENPSPDLP